MGDQSRAALNLLQVEHLTVRLGGAEILHDLSLTVQTGQITVLAGSNGAGKTTLLKVLSGILPADRGKIVFDGNEITHLPSHQRVALGLVQVPEGRHLFPSMTVREHLELGSIIPRARRKRKENLMKVFALFPILGERAKQQARTLSGGEQQMLAIGRALMAEPRLLLLDELSLGLAPRVASEILAALPVIRSDGVTVLLVEQEIQTALELGHWGYVLENGRLVLSGGTAELLQNERVRKAYLGW